MRLLLPCVSLVFVIATSGCNREPDAEVGGKPDREPSILANAEVTQSAEPVGVDQRSIAEPNSTDDAPKSDMPEKARGGRGVGPGQGRGPGMGGMGRGAGAMGGMREDMTTLHAMFAARDKICRKITDLPDGAEAVTESDDETIVSLLQQHVPAMEGRVLKDNPLPPMSFHPIFVELIKHSEEYSLTYEETHKGIKVRYTSDVPYVVVLVQEHAKLVSRFISNGMEEIHKPYTLPQQDQENEHVNSPVGQTK